MRQQRATTFKEISCVMWGEKQQRQPFLIGLNQNEWQASKVKLILLFHIKYATKYHQKKYVNFYCKIAHKDDKFVALKNKYNFFWAFFKVD